MLETALMMLLYGGIMISVVWALTLITGVWFFFSKLGKRLRDQLEKWNETITGDFIVNPLGLVVAATITIVLIIGLIIVCALNSFKGYPPSKTIGAFFPAD